MKNKTSPAKSSLIYAVLFGIIMIFELVIGYVMNVDPTTNPMYGSIINILNFLILPLLFIYLGCNEYKIKINSGFINFNECLKIGVSICVVAALIFSVFSAGFNLIFPDYLVDMYNKVAKMTAEKNPQLTAEQIEMSITIMKKFSIPYIAIPVTVAMYAFIGLIYSLIIGAIVKKDPNKSFYS